MMKNVSPIQDLKFSGFLGINNVDPPSKCKPGELQKATNVNITATGEIKTRDGRSKVYSGTPHSPYAYGEKIFFREADTLKRFDSLGYSTTDLLTGIQGSNPMAYLGLNGEVYFSDSIMTGITDGSSARTWGIAVPHPPTVSQDAGEMIPGRYLVSVAHMRYNGEVGGTSEAVPIDVTQGGILISNIPVSTDPTVLYTVVYMTTSGGEVLYEALVLRNGTASAVYRGTCNEFKKICSTQFLSPPPPGHMIQFFGSRIWICADNVAWYTEPYSYGLVNMMHNYIVFDSRISVFAPVSDGIWVATQTLTQFLAGRDPDEGFKPITKADHGALEGSQIVTTDVGKGGEQVRLWVWAAADGICLAGDGGMFKNITEEKYTIPGTPTRGAAVLLEKDEGSFYVVNLI